MLLNVVFKFQSTPPARGATVKHVYTGEKGTISIHAPREGSDHIAKSLLPWLSISIHAPREGSDENDTHISSPTAYFNPRPPRGERHYQG